jgi:hypothetical protein
MPPLVEIGTVSFDQDVDPSLLPLHLAACLRNANANSVEVRDNLVTFEAGMFRFVTNLNVLVPFGFGDITVNSETREVRYCLSYRQLVISSIITFGINGNIRVVFPRLPRYVQVDALLPHPVVLWDGRQPH